jgi:hypothetical protein
MSEIDIQNLLVQNETTHEPYWSKVEKEVLQEEVFSRSGIIDGRFKGAHSGKQEKERAWEEIVAAVNA